MLNLSQFDIPVSFNHKFLVKPCGLAKILLILIFTLTTSRLYAQTGSFEYTATLATGRTVHLQLNEPLAKFDDYRCYWFNKPGQDRYFTCSTGHMGTNALRGRGDDTTFTYSDKFNGNQLNFEVVENNVVTGFLKPDAKLPIKLHYNIFTPSEIYITFSGPVKYEDGKSFDNFTTGVINGSIHLYREGKYEHSDALPNCSCDPAIYAYTYDPELGRTPSACENALLWQIYNGLNHAFTKLYTISYTGESRPVPPGSILYRGSRSTLDVSGPLSAVIPCSPSAPVRALVSVNSHERLFSESDIGGSYFSRIPDSGLLNPKNAGNMAQMMKGYATEMDSINKLRLANKITLTQQINITNAYAANLKTGMPDMQQLEMENNLAVNAEFNLQIDQAGVRGFNDELSHATVEHKIPGAAFEIRTRAVKMQDGNWTKNKLYVFFGNYKLIADAGGVKSILPLYKLDENKLTLFNVVIILTGGKDLIEIGTDKIDFSVIPTLLHGQKSN